MKRSISAAMEHTKHERPAIADSGKPIHDHLRDLQDEHGGKHVHIHAHDGGGFTSHQIGESGDAEGPHEHESIDELKKHLDDFLSEEESEYDDGPDNKDDEGLM